MIQLFKEITEINLIESKSLEFKMIKFHEEYGEFCAEFIKMVGYTHKPFDKDHLIEEMADVLQNSLSIISHIFKDSGESGEDFIKSLNHEVIRDNVIDLNNVNIFIIYLPISLNKLYELQPNNYLIDLIITFNFIAELNNFKFDDIIKKVYVKNEKWKSVIQKYTNK